MENEIQKQSTENQIASLPQNEALSLYGTVSTLRITEEEQKKLSAEFDESIIEIRPDGHIYLPQSYYRQRLNESVGIGQWGLVPKGSHQEVNGTKTKLFLNGVLVIRGCFVAEAVGEAELHSTNDNQSIATVWESAKSDCITRCCKDMSIAVQIYQPTYIRNWQEAHAVCVWVNGKQKPQWRKRTSKPFLDEKGEVGSAQNNYTGSASNPEHEKQWLNKTTASGGTKHEWVKACEDLKAGTTTITELKKLYKISRAIEEELALIKPGAEEKKEEKKATEEKIEGKWYAMLEKCKTKLEVDQLALTHKEIVQANPALYALFQETRLKLPAQKTAAA